MLRAVYWWLAGFLGLGIGVLATWAVIRVVEASRHPVDTLATSVQVLPVEPTLATAADLMEMPVAVIGAHDEILHANEAALTSGVVDGSRVADNEVIALVRASREKDAGQRRDIDLRRIPHGPLLHWTASTGPVDGHGTMILVVTDRAPLLRADQARRDFVANISHELKTPIGAVSILAEAVEGAADDPDGVRHFAGRMQAETARLSALVTQVIDLSRLQSDEPLLRAEPVAAREVLDDAVHRADELAHRREVAIVVRCQKGLEVMGDAALLTDAVANLVQNAIVYSAPRARVSVSARSQGDRVEIAVSDNGIGIAEKDLDRIFERFYRVDYARSRDNGGTGLGLSLVKHIARVHGGAVDVWSKLGQGSTFTLRLPVRTAPSPTGEAPTDSTTTDSTAEDLI
ncbi:sensor histidine kinase [Acidipropionibacterium virtanenii]|uniref:Sensor-like histidine kinase SenX3 n=1 Tax=Acidipropionibacterium virtanenii TaxID=2057246 RepID=A0A344UWK5_9ACTN|nr:Signal-transduction histidine kinase senX3 [Acidipropionibacterium virtanenii]